MYLVENLDKISETELSNILDVWESSVRSTHFFLSENDIGSLLPLVKSGVTAVETLCCIKCSELIVAFMGVNNFKIEMLFVDAVYRGRGIGCVLLDYAVENLSANKVDVNEQNPQAVGFYRYMGFEVYERSEWDDLGNNFTILHMRLEKASD